MRKTFDKVFWILIVISIVYTLLTVWRNPELIRNPYSDEWKNVTHDEYSFSIDYPDRLYLRLGDEHGIKGYKEAKLVVGAFGASALPDMLRITVLVNTIDSPNLEYALEWRNEYFQGITSDPVRLINSGYREIILLEDVLNGEPIYRRRYIFDKSEIMAEEIYISRDTDIVIIQLEVSEDHFEEYLPVFNRMVESFESLE